MDNRPQPNRNQSIQNRETRIALREKKQNYVLVAIATTFVLILLTFAILLCAMVVDNIRQRSNPAENPDKPGDDPNTPATPDDQDPENPGDQTDPNQGQEDPKEETILIPAASMGEGNLILVNREHVYSFPASTSHLVNIYNSQEVAKTRGKYYLLSGDKLRMEKNAYQALNKMLTTFSQTSGLSNVLMTSAYRSYDDQAGLHSSTPAGYSDSHTGLSCALRVMDNAGNTLDLKDSDSYEWIYNNCYKYGFVVRYPDDKDTITGVSSYNYYFRYVGYVHAYIMKQNNFCLEEYIDYLRGYPMNGTHLTLTADDGTGYEIYYVAATGTQTSVTVPTDRPYTLSGDNVSGYIVTVTGLPDHQA